MADILITTTPILDKIEIKKYLGPLTSNVVLGVNYFSDFAASFTDVFGGNSGTYQSKLDNLTSQVNKLMKEKALRLGANAIIDYKLLFNEISGKGKQMFMATATGTACVIDNTKLKQEEDVVPNQASFAQVRRQYLTELYNNLLPKHKYLNNKDWENILSFDLYEITKELTDEFFYLNELSSKNAFDIDYKKNFTDKYNEFIGKIDKEIVADNIYPFYESFPEIVFPIIQKLNLFVPQKVIKLLEKGSVDLALRLLQCHKDYYSLQDLSEMIQIINLIDNLPSKGSIQTMKSGLFSKKEEEFYVCPNGHKNPKDTVYCTNFDCALNIKGLTKEDVTSILVFKKFTEALSTVMKK